MRRVEDAFAMVSTDGVPNVPILQENRLVGFTDADGLLLVNRLNAWQNNRLSIDPLQAPADVRLGRTDTFAVPASRSGMLVRFPMQPVLSVQTTVTGTDGQPLAAGSPVWLSGADPATTPALTVVGYDGLLYLEALPPGAGLRIRQNGGYCDVVLPELPKPSGFIELDGVVCR
jgi:outer membrane usher protein